MALSLTRLNDRSTQIGLETWMAKVFKEHHLDLQGQLEVHQTPCLMTMSEEYILSFHIATTVKETEAELPFLLRVKAAYKLLADCLPLIFPDWSFSVVGPTKQLRADSLTIDNVVKNAKIENIFMVQGEFPHSVRFAIAGVHRLT